MSIVFRQLFDPETCTLSYLLADPLTGDAVLIDTVKERVGAYVSQLQEMNLQLVWILETHAHGDHISGAAGLQELTGASTATGESAIGYADRILAGGDTVVFGNEVLRVILTPGHTAGSVTYHWRDRIFTGDALMIGGCGRTDFPTGDPGRLYDSITEHLFTLPDETLVFPGHDYKGMRVSCIGQERDTNPRLAGFSREAFVSMMNKLQLPLPADMDEALGTNLPSGNASEEAIIDIHAV
jgi:glyoxylase-like metal-dependent hydrolase (beta-lactamase superfamily II)